MRAVVVLVALATAAHADDGGDHPALRDVLGEASAIVRGSAIESTRSGAFLDTRFAVAEAIRGDTDAEIVVRQPAGEEPLGRDDVILLLDGKTADGAFPLHHPAGRYRVDGDDVVVNASGVDGASLSAKDLRPRAPDERVPLDRFRVLAGGPPTRVDATPALAPPPPRPAHVASAAHDPPPPAQDSTPARWPWLVALLAVAALVVFGARRAR